MDTSENQEDVEVDKTMEKSPEPKNTSLTAFGDRRTPEKSKSPSSEQNMGAMSRDRSTSITLHEGMANLVVRPVKPKTSPIKEETTPTVLVQPPTDPEKPLSPGQKLVRSLQSKTSPIKEETIPTILVPSPTAPEKPLSPGQKLVRLIKSKTSPAKDQDKDETTPTKLAVPPTDPEKSLSPGQKLKVLPGVDIFNKIKSINSPPTEPVTNRAPNKAWDDFSSATREGSDEIVNTYGVCSEGPSEIELTSAQRVRSTSASRKAQAGMRPVSRSSNPGSSPGNSMRSSSSKGRLESPAKSMKSPPSAGASPAEEVVQPKMHPILTRKRTVEAIEIPTEEDEETRQKRLKSLSSSDSTSIATSLSSSGTGSPKCDSRRGSSEQL